MTDFDDLLAKAEAATPHWTDATSALNAYMAAVSPDVIRALVLRLRDREADVRDCHALMKDAEIRAFRAEERLREAEAALRPFQQVGWPSVSDPDDNEGDIPDFTEVDVVASGFDLNATDYMVDPLTVGDFRRLAAYCAAHETRPDVTQAPLLNADDTQADTTEGGE